MSEFSLAGWGFVPDELKHLPKISVSGLCLVAQSPAHYESRYLLKEEEESTDAMKLGTAIHMAVLEPEKFEKQYCRHPGDPPSYVLDTADQMKEVLRSAGLKISGTKAELIGRIRDSGLDALTYDDWWAREIEGREPLKEKDWKACHRIRARIEDDHELKFQISGGEAEKLGWALHHRTGVVITFKADYVRLFKTSFGDYGGVVTDVKKVPRGKADERRFGYIASDKQMHIQAACYTEILGQIFNVKLMFTWLTVEDAPPYQLLGIPCDFGVLEKGRIDFNIALDKFLLCREMSKWPLPKKGLRTIVWPEHAWKDSEE